MRNIKIRKVTKADTIEAAQDRKEKILEHVIQHYLSRGEPVASKFLVVHCHFNVSSATIRNDFQELTGEGYLYKCHLASGRIPTDKALKYFINNILKDEDILNYWTNKWEHQLKQWQRVTISELLDFVADKSHSLAFYYDPKKDLIEKHGLKYIFSRLLTDSRNKETVTLIAEAIDHLEEQLQEINVSQEPLVFIGRDNPFIPGDNFSTLLTRSFKSNNIYGLLGFKSMPYDKHLGLLNALAELI